MPVETLRGNIESAAGNLFARVAKGEITDDRARETLREYADPYLDPIDLANVPAKDAWIYGNLFRTARRYEEARKLYAVAVKTAPDQDRRVNDTLRLAELTARSGDVPEAVRLARSVFDAPPKEKAPILLACYLEIAPAGAGKGADGSLAELVADAMAQAMRTEVDASSDVGKAFLTVRPLHLARAAELAGRLATGDPAATARVSEAIRRARLVGV